MKNNKNIYEFEALGVTPMLQHRMPEEELLGLLSTRKTQKKKPEADAVPREIAERYVYRKLDGTCFAPAHYFQGAFIEASSEYKMSNTSRKSLKSMAAGVIRFLEPEIILRDLENKPLKTFEVDLRKGTNHLKGAVCVVRPRFDVWKVKTKVMVDETLIDQSRVLEILQDAGHRVGVGSFRVSKRGYFGQYDVTSWQKV